LIKPLAIRLIMFITPAFLILIWVCRFSIALKQLISFS
jgi:hypothetical protein